jgi:lysophospholipase L1-like esterase
MVDRTGGVGGTGGAGGGQALSELVLRPPVGGSQQSRRYFLLGLVFVPVGLVAAVLTAFDVRPFGTEALLVAAGVMAALALVATGAVLMCLDLVFGRDLRARLLAPRTFGGWTWPRWVRVWYLVLAGLLVVLVIWAAWWLWSSERPALAKIGWLVGGAVLVGLGAWLARKTEDESSFPGWRTLLSLGSLNSLTGFALGVVIAIVPIVVISAVRTHRYDTPSATPPTLETVYRHVVALGDSYSAGEGLRPYLPGTDDVDVENDGGDRCHRSNGAYSQQLGYREEPDMDFQACSGAVVADLFTGHPEPRRGGSNSVEIPAQVDPDSPPDNDVDLVLLTMGGNDMGFSSVVTQCFREDDCLAQSFDFDGNPRDLTVTQWADYRGKKLADELRESYRRLREHYPQARVVVLGYPYLFPGDPARIGASDCDLILRRVSEKERDGLRKLQDEFTQRIYHAATRAGVEFVSPQAVWNGHEPCGDRGQYVNAINPLGPEGSFHPNRAGQRALAALVSCYLNEVRQPLPGRYALLPWELRVTSQVPAIGTLARPVPCPEADKG